MSEFVRNRINEAVGNGRSIVSLSMMDRPNGYLLVWEKVRNECRFILRWHDVEHRIGSDVRRST